ncbi:hypothetical protein MKW94_011603 [Papaver nudicaule]|uniref:Pectinesterase inhibitor domain-containing protein n=1 Tax=Papaver nudicaule TaxID=74823 RepID=A0AA41UVR1_PAPNU|nr:hypothetical protein [Papaver nudicaule]
MFSVLVLLVVFSIHGITVNAAGDLVSGVCQKTASSNPSVTYGFCSSSLQANPKSRTSDIFGLGEISLQLSLSKAAYVTSRINSLKDGRINPDVKATLNACSTYYRNVVSNVQGAINAFKGRDFASAGSQIASALESAQDCKDGFVAGIVAPVEDDVEASINLIYISFSIAGMN